MILTNISWKPGQLYLYEHAMAQFGEQFYTFVKVKTSPERRATDRP